MNNSIEGRVASLKLAIRDAALASERDPESISLIAVSKTRSAEEVLAAFRAGISDFGENRIQEAEGKIGAVNRLLANDGSDSSAIRWHLIGHLQSNKVRRAVELFDVIHSVDTVDLARRIGRCASETGRLIECYMQVNASGENSKSGASFDDADEVVTAVVSEPNLRFIGLMTIGPLSADVRLVTDCFTQLRDFRDELQNRRPFPGNLGLSMGMSGDFALAIHCGSTAVRIGTAIFGERE